MYHFGVASTKIGVGRTKEHKRYGLNSSIQCSTDFKVSLLGCGHLLLGHDRLKFSIHYSNCLLCVWESAGWSVVIFCVDKCKYTLTKIEHETRTRTQDHQLLMSWLYWESCFAVKLLPGAWSCDLLSFISQPTNTFFERSLARHKIRFVWSYSTTLIIRKKGKVAFFSCGRGSGRL